MGQFSFFAKLLLLDLPRLFWSQECKIPNYWTKNKIYKTNLIELFIKLAQLGNLLHNFFPHEEGCVEEVVVLTVQDPQCKVN